MTTLLEITHGVNGKPGATEVLLSGLENQSVASGKLLVGFPIIRTATGAHPVDALLISPNLGVVIFDLVESSDLGDYQRRQDDAANLIEARLRTHRTLLHRRALRVPIHTLSFAPLVSDLAKIDGSEYRLANSESLLSELEQLTWDESDPGVYEATVSAIEGLSTIRKTQTRRQIKQPDSRGAKLKKLEDSIATLDRRQSRAVIETVAGVQRIRGLAGSGKTIVLALKAAYLHAQYPEWRIAVTFNTRSLKDQFRRLITAFTIENTGEEPDWTQLRIVNAWGAPGGEGRDGIYYEFCRAHEVDYLDFQDARSKFGRGKEFPGACSQALEQAKQPEAIYDTILIDEAQDFPPVFLRLCYSLLNEPRRLVYAYDELQNLGGASLPAPEEIFGTREDGTPLVSFGPGDGTESSRDVILKRCYRNSRPVLVTAHALGFGIYRPAPDPGSTGLVQMFDHPHLWEEIGYKTDEGELESGSVVSLSRPEDSSPRFLENHSPLNDLIQFHTFLTEQDQAEWLTTEILENLGSNELRYDDIVVINPDPLTTRTKVGIARGLLLEQGVNSHLAGVDTNPDVFFKPDQESITFSGIYRAKGNEAGMVYIINAQDCHSSARNLARIRNQLFTAITRSKAWVRVLGVGDGMRALGEEYEEVKRREFTLRFRYPTQEERDKLKIVHRDMTQAQQRRLEKSEKELAALIRSLEAGRLHPEDLDDAIRQKLAALLNKSRD